jgi:hypothetical protein
MDTLDRPDVNLPARLQPGSSRLPAQIHVASRELAAAAPPSPVNTRLLWRGLMRHWWHILLLWLVVSIPGVYLVYSLIEPTYDASSTLRIEPSYELFGPSAKGIASSNQQSRTSSWIRVINPRSFPSSESPTTPRPMFASGWASVSSPTLP